MATNPERMSRFAQLRQVARLLRQHDPKALPIVVLSAFGTLAIFLVIAFVTGMLLYLIPMGILVSFMVAMILFGQLAQRLQYRILDGQPGAAAAILQGLRGDWSVTLAVTGNRNYDVVHRAVGRPGIILVGEGSPRRLAGLLATEKKRTARVAYETPIYDFQAGNEEGQIPLRKLSQRIMRLPRNLRKGEVAEVNSRLKALPQSTPMPHGPLPKGARMPRMPKGPQQQQRRR